MMSFSDAPGIQPMAIAAFFFTIKLIHMKRSKIFYQVACLFLILPALITSCQKQAAEPLEPSDQTASESALKPKGSNARTFSGDDGGVSYLNDGEDEHCNLTVSWSVSGTNGLPIEFDVQIAGVGLIEFEANSHSGSQSFYQCLPPGTIITVIMNIGTWPIQKRIIVSADGTSSMPLEGDPDAPIAGTFQLSGQLNTSELTINLDWTPSSSGTMMYVNAYGSPGQQRYTVPVSASEGHATITIPRYQDGPLYNMRLTVTTVNYPSLEYIPDYQRVDCRFYIDGQASAASWNQTITAVSGNVYDFHANPD